MPVEHRQVLLGGRQLVHGHGQHVVGDLVTGVFVEVVADARPVREQLFHRDVVGDERQVPAEDGTGRRGEAQGILLDQADDRQRGHALRAAGDGELRVDRVGRRRGAMARPYAWTNPISPSRSTRTTPENPVRAATESTSASRGIRIRATYSFLALGARPELATCRLTEDLSHQRPFEPIGAVSPPHLHSYLLQHNNAPLAAVPLCIAEHRFIRGRSGTHEGPYVPRACTGRGGPGGYPRDLTDAQRQVIALHLPAEQPRATEAAVLPRRRIIVSILYRTGPAAPGGICPPIFPPWQTLSATSPPGVMTTPSPASAASCGPRPKA